MRLLPADPRFKWAVVAAYTVAGLAVLALLAIAAFPIGALKPVIEKKLTARFGRAVTIGTLERQDVFSLHPEILVQDVRVPQPAWAGGGDLARIGQARLRLSALALLRGQVAPQSIALSDAHIALVRAKDGRENWHGDSRDSPSRNTPAIERLSIANSSLSYRDAKRDRQFVLRLAADTTTGLTAKGRGTVRGSAVTVAFTGGAIGRETRDAWPFRATIDGSDLTMTATGTMASPLDTNRMSLDVKARATDLKYLDAIIEAGLFRTRPVRLIAHVERVAPDWKITKLRGTIGRSTLDGHVDIAKRDGRTRIDGAIASGLLDFDDLGSNQDVAQGLAEERALGLRLVPDTRIDIGKIDRTDGRIAFTIARIISRRGESAIRSARGTFSLERQLLTVDPVRVALAQGAITGRMTVDQRGDRAVPTVTMDLRLTGSSIPAVAGGGGSLTGRLDGRAYLVGRGHTIRGAVGTSTGRIGIAARDGALPLKIANALGFDAGRAIFDNDRDRAGLRCVIVGVTMRGGQGRIGPFVLDTTQSRMHGEGSVSFPSEALAIRLTGAPKRDAVLRLPGSATMAGTIREPDILVPREVKSIGNIFKAIGRAIRGRQGPVATDADCAALAGQVLH